MLANYGYSDGSGDFYITIDTDKCNACSECINVCPTKLYEIITDDYDEETVSVKEEFRKQLKYACSQCKPDTNRPALPCVKVCNKCAIKHSW